MPNPTKVKPTPEQDLAEEALFIHERIRACNSKTRVELLALLLGGPMDVTRIAEKSGLDIPNVSRNLTILKKDGLVVCYQDKTRHIHMLSRAIRIEDRNKTIVLRMSTGGCGALSISYPTELVLRLHPGYRLPGAGGNGGGAGAGGPMAKEPGAKEMAAQEPIVEVSIRQIAAMTKPARGVE